MIAAVLNALSNGDEIHLKFQLDGSTAPYCMIRMQAVVSERERGCAARIGTRAARSHRIAGCARSRHRSRPAVPVATSVACGSDCECRHPLLLSRNVHGHSTTNRTIRFPSEAHQESVSRVVPVLPEPSRVVRRDGHRIFAAFIEWLRHAASDHLSASRSAIG